MAVAIPYIPASGPPFMPLPWNANGQVVIDSVRRGNLETNVNPEPVPSPGDDIGLPPTAEHDLACTVRQIIPHLKRVEKPGAPPLSRFVEEEPSASSLIWTPASTLTKENKDKAGGATDKKQPEK